MLQPFPFDVSKQTHQVAQLISHSANVARQNLGLRPTLIAMTIEDADDLAGLEKAGRVVSFAREAMLGAVTPGVSTGDLDAIGREILRNHGARSAPKVTYNFPGFTCVSVNNEAAHGIPSISRVLKSGDIVNIDISAELDGYYADTGASTAVGEVASEVHDLLDATRLAQSDAMHAARAGASLKNVARAVQRRARSAGFTVVEDLMGHGIGRSLHEYPDVPNVVTPGNSPMLHEGMVLAIEPFLSLGATRTVQALDGWTLVTDNGSLVAQFEHTVVVTKSEPIVLTTS